MFAECKEAYPNLAGEFEAVLARVGKGVKVDIRDAGGKSLTVEPSVAVLTEGIRHYRYSADGRMMPRMIHQAFEGDLRPLVQMAVNSQASYQRSLAFSAMRESGRSSGLAECGCGGRFPKMYTRW